MSETPRAAGKRAAAALASSEERPSKTLRKRTPSAKAKAGLKKEPATPASDTTTGEKASKGLRHFSMKVCSKVEAKGRTSYNEVADELVKEVMAERSAEEPRGKYDEKNIRRRVYDALNVLMAMDIISKDKKEIRWKGLPSNAHHDLDMLQRELQFRRKEVERKRESLRELLVQQVCFRNLVTHNQRREAKGEERIPLPFIVVNTNSSAVIQCEMSPDRSDVMFDFSMPFEINDDNTILKRLGM
jgi:transcription factor Dp-1